MLWSISSMGCVWELNCLRDVKYCLFHMYQILKYNLSHLCQILKYYLSHICQKNRIVTCLTGVKYICLEMSNTEVQFVSEMSNSEALFVLVMRHGEIILASVIVNQRFWDSTYLKNITYASGLIFLRRLPLWGITYLSHQTW